MTALELHAMSRYQVAQNRVRHQCSGGGEPFNDKERAFWELEYRLSRWLCSTLPGWEKAFKEEEERMSIAEQYRNTEYLGHPCDRWWAHPLILVGGSICSLADGQHLVRDFGIQAVVSVESEHTDDDKIPDAARALRVPVPDDGTPPPARYWHTIVEWVKLLPGQRLYVHCQMGGSRSPAVAYAIMRWVFGMSAEEALASIRRVKSDYGTKPYHQSYLASAEAAFAQGAQ